MLWDPGCYGRLGVMGYWVLWEPQPRPTALKELHVPSGNVKISSKVFEKNLHEIDKEMLQKYPELMRM